MEEQNLNEYLNRNRSGNSKSKQISKIRNSINDYQTMKIKFPYLNIKYENLKSTEYLSNLQSHNIDVPSYWKHRTPKEFYTEEYLVPHCIGNLRKDFYSNNINIKKTGFTNTLSVNLQLLYNRCSDYKSNLILNCPYDGADTFFIKQCCKGMISEQLGVALGQANIFYKERNKVDSENELHGEVNHYKLKYIENPVDLNKINKTEIIKNRINFSDKKIDSTETNKINISELKDSNLKHNKKPSKSIENKIKRIKF